MLSAMFAKRLMALPTGSDSIRFRLPLVIGDAEVDEALERVAACLPSRV